MPTCQDCRFYTVIDDLKGECFSLGFEVRGKTDSKKCPERAFRPNKSSNSKKTEATRY
ncbi:MAG: hypothetical protein PHF18_10140 [Methanosarcina sp.]|uniref:hypothetical protein n=1 Tax=Methanosarcina sp. TaxID=2213 RepID=UPI002629A72E|nr:hypothetical protein [Methanosarcina sp.]MDD3247190.1 hypothetical protein [Methanosarcina sp.]